MMRDPSTEEIERALAANLDAEGHDIGLEAEVREMSPEARAQSEQNLRAFVAALRESIDRAPR